MSLAIRAYKASDEAAVIRLWQACELVRPWNDPAADIRRKVAFQPAGFVVGSVDDRVVASVMAGYDGHRGWINYLAVDPAERGQGHALALLRHVEALLLAVGCPKINLQVRASNTDALGFYRHLGWAEDSVASYGLRLIDDVPPG